MHLSGKKEDGFLSNVSSWASFGFPVLFQAYIPVHLFVVFGLISVVVVFL